MSISMLDSDLETNILEDVGAAAPAPGHDGLVAGPQQCHDLRAEQRDHRNDPLAEDGRPPGLADHETVEHADDIVGAIPGLAGDPAVGREQTNRLAHRIEHDRDEMGNLVAGTLLQRSRLRQWPRSIGDRGLRKNQRRHSGGNAVGAQKGVKVPVLAGRSPSRRVDVIEILGVGVRIVDLTFGIVPPLRERQFARRDLAEEAVRFRREPATTLGEGPRRGLHLGEFGRARPPLNHLFSARHWFTPANETWPQ